MIRFIIQAPRWLFLGALLYAPWAYGSTRPWTITVLLIQLSVVFVLWMLGCALRRSWPEIPRIPLYAMAFLLLQAWGMALNATHECDPLHLTTEDQIGLVRWAPVSIHKSLSLFMAWQASSLLLAGCFVCDLVQRPLWRKRLLLTMALSGISIVLLGLSQRFANAPGILWGTPLPGETFFATYRYHANAGAFMNLAWPVVAAFFVLALARRRTLQVFWGISLALCLAAMFVNSSRAATLIAIFLGLIWLIWLVIENWRRKSIPFLTPAGIVGIGLVVILLLSVFFMFGGLDASWKRWGQFSEQFSSRNPRLLIAQVCLGMVPEAGWWGFGPGTFQTIIPYRTYGGGDEIGGVWLCAHQDYLQTVIEWGWSGALAWAVIVFGGLLYSWRMSRKHDWSTKERVYYFAILTALAGVLLHALGDFPLQIASIQLYVAVMVAMLWGSGSWGKKNDQCPMTNE